VYSLFADSEEIVFGDFWTDLPNPEILTFWHPNDYPQSLDGISVWSELQPSVPAYLKSHFD
jgi:hypothetical protein